MPRYIRPRRPGATIFFTVNLALPGSSLLVDEVTALRAAVRDTMAQRPFRIDAWVVLPDHLHAIWTLPPGDSDYPTRWRAIKARFTRLTGAEGPCTASRHAKGEKGVWQRRYWEHHIRDAADLRAHLHYCWQDPVRHGLCVHPAEWRYSSLHRDRALAGRLSPPPPAPALAGERPALARA
jgi:putative transposase